jgi:hypothetical protein
MVMAQVASAAWWYVFLIFKLNIGVVNIVNIHLTVLKIDYMVSILISVGLKLVVIKSLAHNMPSLNVSMHMCLWSIYDSNVFGGNVHVY